MKFKEKLSNAIEKNNSLLCIGLDIDKESIPKSFAEENNNLLEFNKKIIAETEDLVCAYKLNMAFYEVLGKKGFDLLEKTLEFIPKDIVIILDGKRNDIGNTAEKYAKCVFETFNADATTVNPYLGSDSIMPFLKYKDRCTFVLCRTSNPSAREIQDIVYRKKHLYEIVANKIKEWNNIGCCGAVVGATYPEELSKIRKILGDSIPILIPGIGKQGGDIEKTVKCGTNREGENAIVVCARSIIYANNPREEALKVREEINRFRKDE